MERPRRSNPKKWDPSFVSTLHPSPLPAATKPATKRTSLNNDVSFSESSEKPSKRVAKKQQTNPPDSVPQMESVTVASPLPKQVSSQVNAMEVCQTETKAMAEADTSTSFKRSQPCPKISCVRSGFKPKCFVKFTDRCAGDDWTSRWYHVSLGEHYCNDCFDICYRSNKAGYAVYSEWKRLWSRNGTSEANIKMFFSDKYLPYWVQCNTCKKWREVPKDTAFTSQFVEEYVCQSHSKNGKTYSCEVAEDPRVRAVGEPGWISMLLTLPYMTSSPTASFLVNYAPDSVGLSASIHQKAKLAKPKNDSKESGVESDEEDAVNSSEGAESANLLLPQVSGVSEYIQPFSQPNVDRFMGSLPANQMTDDEKQNFPEFAREQLIYLVLRNLILALWALNPKQLLTVRQCVTHLLCRGLVRIRCILELPAVLKYLSLKNYVNTGIISGPMLDVFPHHSIKGKVLVIGAGPAGLGAAQKLSKLGIEVTVIEARNRVGGRVWDENIGGICVGHGAQLINGSYNNPFALLCLQTDTPLTEISDRCCLIEESGQVVDFDVDSKLDYHFETMLDQVAAWKKTASEDCSLLEKLTETHQSFLAESNTSFTAKEEQLFYFHIANLEHACGASLNKVSACHWDQNEVFTQFGGSLCILPCGYTKLMEQLSHGIDIVLNTSVAEISKSNSSITVKTVSGDTYTADYIFITVPLSLLQRRAIQFVPPLPDWKLQAIDRMGVGLLEKVVLIFPQRFWATKVAGCDFFGRVPSQPEKRGLFSVFQDITSRVPNDVTSTTDGVLVTFLSGDAAHVVHEKSDEEIVELCVASLRNMFPEQEVEKPTSYVVTRWQDDEFARMAYSFVPVNCSGDVYDKLAAPVDKKIFFAGEATNRMHPQTVTGAYLSGLRAVDTLLELHGDISFNSPC